MRIRKWICEVKLENKNRWIFFLRTANAQVMVITRFGKRPSSRRQLTGPLLNVFESFIDAF